MATIAVCARHLFMSARNFQTLLDRGAITRSLRGDYNLDTVRREYIAHIKSVAQGVEGGGPSSLSEARTRYAAAKASTAEHENEREHGKWVEFDLAVKLMVAELLAARENMLGMAGIIADPLHLVQREKAYSIVRRASFDCLDRLADGLGCANVAVECAERAGGRAYVGLLQELVEFYKLAEVKRDA